MPRISYNIKKSPALAVRCVEFLRTCSSKQVGVYQNTHGLLTTKKCEHARHIYEIDSSYKLVGSKNSVYTHYAGKINIIFIIVYIV